MNVASESEFTESHYRDLPKLQEYLGKENKFQVLVFPCNQFGGQEPGDNYDIFEQITDKYYINFPMFSKIDVLGENASPAFRNLIGEFVMFVLSCSE